MSYTSESHNHQSENGGTFPAELLDGRRHLVRVAVDLAERSIVASGALVDHEERVGTVQADAPIFQQPPQSTVTVDALRPDGTYDLDEVRRRVDEYAA